MLKRVFELLTVELKKLINYFCLCTIGEREKIDFSWLPTVTLHIDKMASLKIEEEFILSKARTRMVAYEKLQTFRKSKFNRKYLQSNHQSQVLKCYFISFSGVSDSIRTAEDEPSPLEKQHLFEAAKCLDDARAIGTEIEKLQERINVNMAKMRHI